MGHVAKAFIAGTPQAEVIGQTVLAFSENMQADIIAPLLPKHHLTQIDPKVWYPHQNWLNVLRDLEIQLGSRSSATFVAFGKEVVSTAVMPQAIKSIPDVLMALHDIHHLNLRNIPKDEGYGIEKRDEREYQVYHNTPNPDDVIYGFLWGLAARYKRLAEQFAVRRLSQNPRPEICRSTFLVTWGPNDGKF